MNGVSEAYYEAIETAASKIPQRPLPAGINEVEVGDWKLTLNASGQDQEHEGMTIPAWEVIAQHQKFLIIASIGPAGGSIGGGMSEDEFIADMRAARGDIVEPTELHTQDPRHAT